MKHVYFLLILILAGHTLRAQIIPDSIANKPLTIQPVAFPGGIERFYSYIANRMEALEVKQLIGISGKVKVSFVVDTMGNLVDIKPLPVTGSIAEKELVNILSTCTPWKPAIANGRKVRQPLNVPFTFNFPKKTIKMAELRKGINGYLFGIKDTVYSIDQAASILGESFPAERIETAIVYTSPDKHGLVDKPQIYLINIKS